MPDPSAELLSSFAQGAITTLKFQCSTDATAGKPFLKTSDNPGVEIAGIIEVNSPALKASVALCFPSPTYLALMSKMLGETFTKLTVELEDGVKELMNIIFGQAKIALNKNGHAIEMAIPKVIRGQNLKIDHWVTGSAIVLPLNTQNGDLYLEFVIPGIKLQ